MFVKPTTQIMRELRGDIYRFGYHRWSQPHVIASSRASVSRATRRTIRRAKMK